MVEENQDAVVETGEIEEVAAPEVEAPAETPAESNEAVENSEETDQDEVVVTIGEDSPPQEEKEAPEWVKELRKQNRETSKKNKELEKKLKSYEQAETKPATLGAKPTLEDSDYDTEKHEAALDKWYEQKRNVELEEENVKKQQKAQVDAWNATLEGYGTAKQSLKVKDFEEAEETVLETLSETQQGMILQGADNAALVVYALGKNPTKAKELASISDPVKFAFAVGKLESTLKVSSRKAPPPPERTVKGSGNSSGAVDSTLEKLRADAQKSGDHSKVMSYIRQKKKG